MLYLYRHRVSKSRIGLIHGLHLHEAVPGSSFLHKKRSLPALCWVPRSTLIMWIPEKHFQNNEGF
jgi:hypothetical protein